jgi:hypothetical protein
VRSQECGFGRREEEGGGRTEMAMHMRRSSSFAYTPTYPLASTSAIRLRTSSSPGPPPDHILFVKGGCEKVACWGLADVSMVKTWVRKRGRVLQPLMGEKAWPSLAAING